MTTRRIGAIREFSSAEVRNPFPLRTRRPLADERGHARWERAQVIRLMNWIGVTMATPKGLPRSSRSRSDDTMSVACAAKAHARKGSSEASQLRVRGVPITPISSSEYLAESLHDFFVRHLPNEIEGYPTNFSQPDPTDTGVQHLEPTTGAPINHRIEIHTIRGFLAQ